MNAYICLCHSPTYDMMCQRFVDSWAIMQYLGAVPVTTVISVCSQVIT